MLIPVSRTTNTLDRSSLLRRPELSIAGVSFIIAATLSKKSDARTICAGVQNPFIPSALQLSSTFQQNLE
jgi:hypothetical protein